MLRLRGAKSLSAEDFLNTSPDDLWGLVEQLAYPFEILNTVDLAERDELAKSSEIKLVVLDVDGVFTDGGMYYSSAGEEMKKFNVKDGMGIVQAIEAGMQVGIISAASRSEVVELRARMLGIQHVYVGKQPKEEVLETWLYTMGLGFEHVAYIGDDINDVALLKKCSLTAAPADAVYQAKVAAKIVLQSKGGEGCIREFFDRYISQKN